MSKFRLGRIIITPGALGAIAESDPYVSASSLLDRHHAGDWGDCGPDDAAANERALLSGARIMSVYKFGNLTIWVVTEADRSATTLLLPDDY